MALIKKDSLGEGKSNRLVVGVYGAGPSKKNYVNYDLKHIIQNMGGTMFNHGAQSEIYSAIEKEASGKNRNIVLIGYSTGGAAAIAVANRLVRDNINIHTLVTIDPVRLSWSMKPTTYALKKYGNNAAVGQAFNFYQHTTPRTAKRIPKGLNPYWGSDLKAAAGVKTIVKSKNVTTHNSLTLNWENLNNYKIITHLNIVTYVLGKA